jgi:hypothetical protein
MATSNTVIQLKRSSSTGNTVTSSDINYGELAINYADGKLFYRKPDDDIGTIYTPNVYSTINVNSSLLVPTSPTKILSLQPQNYITVTGVTGNDTIIISETLSSNVVLKTGGTFTGNVSVQGSLNLVDAAFYSGNTSLATVSQTVIDSFSASTFRSAKYLVQITDNVSNYYHVTELMFIWNGSSVQKIEYAVVTTAGELGTFDADINSGNVRLLLTATDSNSRTVKYQRTLISS